MKKLGLVLGLYLKSLFGINKARFSNDPKERRRTALSIVMTLVFAVYFAAMFAPFFGKFVAQGMRLTLSLFFWITPVAWPAARLNGANAMMALSPIHYVVDAARAAVLAAAPFPAWNRTLWFWCLMIGLAIAGAAGCSRLHEPYREVL